MSYLLSVLIYLCVFISKMGLSLQLSGNGILSISGIAFLYLNSKVCTGCASHFGNPTNFIILKEPMLALKQTIHQRKALDLSFNLAP